MPKKKILITGAYGIVGSVCYNYFIQDDTYDVYGLGRRNVPSARVTENIDIKIPDDHFFMADLTNADQIAEAVAGMDTVIHLAACPDGEGEWETVLEANVNGNWNVLDACVKAGVKRILYASTIMVNWGYWDIEPYSFIQKKELDKIPADYELIDRNSPTMPTSYYASTKILGEALARTISRNEDISILCLRIGGVQGDDKISRNSYPGSIWCSTGDICDIIKRMVEAPDDLKYDLFFGISNSDYPIVDLSHEKEVLGYVPKSKAEDHYSD
ncbi:MAG: NAD(P)-dependent oxidoreductase [Lentisphaeria bacterium]|nr:NAD(P)-dependent oxidoreductase [Lentisphaeria bacterium]NQZ68979.1 NAD(P)-dependent oxidoreductase [Lentisphaeria bacterium]